jgi:DNA polymerase-3 subunit delta
LAKLSAYVGDRPRIEAEDVRSVVGGWKAETTWAMTDAVRDGNLGLAISCLDKLLTAGEAPQRILGGINFVFRKYARATELARQGIGLPAALQQAGVFPRDTSASAAYLRRIGRPRAEQLYGRLLTADQDLKGSSRLPYRLQLEQLLVGLSGRL